jgi:hypothetical protein
VSYADASNYCGVAQDGLCAGEVVEETNSRAKKNCRDVDADFVKEASIQQLLDGVCSVDENRLPGGGGFGFIHGAFDTVRHEVDRRATWT